MLERWFALITMATAILVAQGCCFGGLPNSGPQPAPAPFANPATPIQPAPISAPAIVTIAPGFLPDPQTSSGSAGGPVAASGMSPDCRGHIAAQPNVLLNATGPFTNLRIIVNSGTDTTLVVQRADGVIVCNDDTEGLNPHVSGPFGPGQHRVWVGTYSAAQAGAQYTIGFSELMHVTSASLGQAAPVVAGIGAGAGIPQECGMTVPNYGTVTVGTSLVLGVHTPYSGPDGQGAIANADTNWTPEMQPWVGQRTTVTALAGLDQSGCPGIRVAADSGQYFWRLRNASL